MAFSIVPLSYSRRFYFRFVFAVHRPKWALNALWFFFWSRQTTMSKFDVFVVFSVEKIKGRKLTYDPIKSHWTEELRSFYKLYTKGIYSLWNCMHDTIQLILQIETQFQKSHEMSILKLNEMRSTRSKCTLLWNIYIDVYILKTTT